MRRNSRNPRGLSLLAAAALLAGCAADPPRGLAASPGRLVPPSLDQIEESCFVLPLRRPADEVWSVALDLASQHQGILALEESDEDRRIVFARQPPADRSTRSEWIALSVIPEEEDSCTVFAVGAEAVDGSVRTLPVLEEMKLDDLTRDEWLVRETLYELRTQLAGPARWRARFGDLQPNGPPRSLGDMTARPLPNPGFPGLEFELGQYESALLMSQFARVDAPEFEQRISDCLERITAAAGRPTVELRPIILACSYLENALVAPNGDVFLFSGLLDSLTTEDQLAAVLAHEVDHHLQHDILQRYVKIAANDRQLAAVLRVFFIPVAGLTNTIAHVTNDVIGAQLLSGFTREQELRADRNAMIYLARAGYDPRALREILDAALRARQRRDV